MCFAVSQQVLPGPEAALKALATAASKKRQEAEAVLATAVSNALHLLNLLKLTLPLLTGEMLIPCHHQRPTASISQSRTALA